MKKITRLIIIFVFMLIVMTAVYWFAFVDMSRLPAGTLIGSYPSPDGVYIVNAYLCGGNATTAYSIRCEVVSNNKSRNIFWKYKESEAQCRWVSDSVIEINGIQLDVTRDTYDWRRN